MMPMEVVAKSNGKELASCLSWWLPLCVLWCFSLLVHHLRLNLSSLSTLGGNAKQEKSRLTVWKTLRRFRNFQNF